MNVDNIIRRSLTGFALAGLLSVGAWAQSQQGSSGSSSGSSSTTPTTQSDAKQDHFEPASGKMCD